MGNVSIPVVVIGNATTAMSCLRLVAKAGFAPFGACEARAWPTTTRYFQLCRTTNGKIWRGELGEPGIEFLSHLPFDSCVLLAAADDAAIWLSELPSEFRDKYFVSSSSADALRTLQDKEKFSILLAQLNVASPQSFSIDSETDFDRVPFDRIDSLFLKPVDSQSFVARYNRKATWVTGADEAKAEWRRLRANGFSVIAQEYVPGGADDHYFIDGFRCRDGIVRARTARRRFRIYPPDFGNSSYCKSIDFDEVDSAWVELERLLLHVNYRGIFSAEFKRDARSGEFKILEVNTRPWVYIEFAQFCGMNMCEMAVRDALQLPIATIDEYKVGKGCVSLYDDMVTVFEMPKEERPPIVGLLWSWVRSFKLLFSCTDPMPAAVFIGRTLRRKLRNLLPQ